MIAATLAHYRITEKIGEGGMGVVYRAHDERLDRDVAIKVLPSGTLADETARKRFRKEALALAKLNHPNIETVHDFDTQEGMDFLVTEYVPGATLDEKLAGRSLPEKEIRPLGEQLAEGLAAAHEQGVVHCDVKVANLRITPGGRLKILDFGLAKLMRTAIVPEATASVAETRGVTGTVPYMAPEQLRGEEVDTRTDIWAAGVVLYELATGQRPFTAELSTRLVDDILHQVPPRPTAVNRLISPGLEGIILKCLEKDPENRYQSAKELGVDLRRLARSAAAALTPTAPAAGAGRFPLMHKFLFAAVAIIVVLAVLLLFNVGQLRHRLSRSLGIGLAPGEITSIAVLPLENLSGDPEQEYFADGMTEALITDLCKIGALKVISRQSVIHFKGTNKSLPEIAKQLKVDAVVEGSVLREGSRVRISAKLVEARTDRHLWAQSYERDLTGILALQSEVAQAIAREIRVTLTPAEEFRLASARPVNPQAYEAVLKGNYFFSRRTEEDLTKGLQYFQQAIAIDPNYARAYLGVADCYLTMAGWALIPPAEAHEKARAAVMKALEIDATLGHAHAILAGIRYEYEWDWAAAEQQFQRALEFGPNLSGIRRYHAEFLSFMGGHAQAISEAKRAHDLDPLTLITSTMVGITLHNARQYDQAIEQCQEVLELNPSFVPALYYLGRAYEQKGQYEEAIARLVEARRISGGSSRMAAGLAHAYAVSGRRDEAQKILHQLTRRPTQTFVSPYEVSIVFVGLGDREQALIWLDRAIRERDTYAPHIKVDPRLDPLRSDPRFQSLLRRMNFPP